MYDDIRVIPAEDGGNPRNSWDIEKREDHFYIFPFSEDGDGNYKFHMNAKIENDSKLNSKVNVVVNWGDTIYTADRKYLLVCKNDDEWECFDTISDGPCEKAEIIVPPGVSYLSLHPRYEHGRLDRLIKKLDKDIFNVKVIGKTRMRRDVYAIEAGNKEMRPIAFYARVHPYETIGSYFTEGMMKWLSGNTEETKMFLQTHHVVLVPMPNPDGVADGTHKLTHGGLNFSGNFRDSQEPEAIALRDYLGKMNPSLVFDLHSWNNRRDNMVTNDPVRGRVIYEELLKETGLFNIPLEILYRHYPMSGFKHSCAYFADVLRTTFINSSWPPMGRSAQNFYDMGVALLKATAKGDLAAGNENNEIM